MIEQRIPRRKIQQLALPALQSARWRLGQAVILNLPIKIGQPWRVLQCLLSLGLLLTVAGEASSPELAPQRRYSMSTGATDIYTGDKRLVLVG